MLDEVDYADTDARRTLLLIWNLGYLPAKRSLVIRGKRKLVNLHAPMMAAGIGGFLASAQKSRTLSLEMRPYTEETAPQRDYWAEEDFSDLNAVYSFLRNWAAGVKLNLKPAMPPGMIRRSAQNVRGLLSIADSCGPEWGRCAREAVVFLFDKEKSERPELTVVRHGLVIFEAFGFEEIGSVRFNRELKRLDLPDAKWTRYRGPSGTDYTHPLEMHEQSALLEKVGIHSTRVRPPGEKQCRGYKLAQFQEAQRKYGVAAPNETEVGRARLRLVKPPSD